MIFIDKNRIKTFDNQKLRYYIHKFIRQENISNDFPIPFIWKKYYELYDKHNNFYKKNKQYKNYLKEIEKRGHLREFLEMLLKI